MPALAEPLQDLDLSVLDDMDFSHTPKCAIPTCGKDATHLLICKCTEGSEYICNKCLEASFKAAKKGVGGVFTFDGACGHTAHLFECQVRPI